MNNDYADHENFDDSIPPTLRAEQLVIAGYGGGDVSRETPEAVINAAALEAPAWDWAYVQRVLRGSE